LKVKSENRENKFIEVYCPFCGTKMDTLGANRRDPYGVNLIRDYNCLNCGFMATFLETVHRGFMEKEPAVNEEGRLEERR
jgi:C4-type Zn-finger protein